LKYLHDFVEQFPPPSLVEFVSFIFQSLVNPGNEGGKREINRTRREIWSQTRRKYPKIKSIKKKEKGGKKAVLLLHQPNVRCFSGGESGEERKLLR
jgi:hypothetical protein